MDNILINRNHRYYFDKVIDMLIYRKWLSKESGEEQKLNYKEKEIYSFDIYINQHKKVKKIKLLVHLNEDDYDVMKMESVWSTNELSTMLFIVFSRNCGTSKYIKNCDSESKYWIEVMHTEMFHFNNINQHIWCSEHSIVDVEETTIFISGSLYDKRTLPTIFHSDNQIRYIGGKVNDIIKIKTNDSIKYRKCIFGYIM